MVLKTNEYYGRAKRISVKKLQRKDVFRKGISAIVVNMMKTKGIRSFWWLAICNTHHVGNVAVCADFRRGPFLTFRCQS
jgi:hypothetical protein